MNFSSFVLLLLLSAPKAAVPAKTAGRYGFPHLAPGQLWVSSVPVGLEVRIGEDPNGKKVIGRTPLVLNPPDVGSHVTVSVHETEYGGALPQQIDMLDIAAKNTHSTAIDYGTYKTDVSRALTFKVPLPGKNSVIALFQSKQLSLKQAERLYPRGSNFRFSHDVVEKQLAAKGVPPDFIRAGIRLLERGGKVALPGARGWLLAEVTSSGRVDVLEPPTVKSN